ncbi:MAG: helix-turn-helix domain-containing protein [Victivallales bacterium]|nr:helix-turn-helix domain-containing protein [Victivallales bacterium]
MKGLEDGIAVLQQLAVSAGPVSCLELSCELGMEKTRVNRLLKTLSHLGIVYRTSSRRYAPGAGMHVLAAQSLYASGLFRVALPHLEMLESLGHLIALGVLWRDKVCYLLHHAPGTPFAEGIGRTRLYPATRSSLGMILLAQQPEDTVRELYGGRGEMEGFDSVESLLGKLCEVRNCGYACVEAAGTVSVAVKIGEPAYAAAGISGKMGTKAERECVGLLLGTAAKIEEEMVNINKDNKIRRERK